MIDQELEEKMAIAQKASSMILSLRRKEKIKVRQPLAKIMVPVLDDNFLEKFDAVKQIILTEVNVKEVEYLNDASGIIRKKIKPDFRKLGPKYGKLMKQISQVLASFTSHDISELEKNGSKNPGWREELPCWPKMPRSSQRTFPGAGCIGGTHHRLIFKYRPRSNRRACPRIHQQDTKHKKEDGYEVTD